VSKDTTCPHELFVKEHSLRHQDDDKPPGRTLFVLNIPPYLNSTHVKSVFSSTGAVSNVIFAQQPHGFQSAYVVFAKREGLLKALQTEMLQLKSDLKTGLEQWIEDYTDSIEDAASLHKEVTTFMKNYDKREDKSKNSSAPDVDDEGWTVVTRKGHKPGVANKESVKLKINEKIVQTKKKKELKNFYTFQIKESKMKNLVALRKNYEEAKKKVELMRSSRRFKPY